jgi:hypothetical protein
MTNRFKDFGSGGEVSKEPLTFKLHDEEFKCKPNLQGKTLLDIVAGASDDGAGAAKSITAFFDVCLMPDSVERFNALLVNPDTIVTVDTLGEITAWLVEEYSSRPTVRPEHSLSGQ